jgi:hypothetical protein
MATGKSLPETDSKLEWQNGAEAVRPTSRPGPLGKESKRPVHRQWRRGGSNAVLAEHFGQSPASMVRVIREVRMANILEQKIEYIYDPIFEDSEAAAEILAQMPEGPRAARNFLTLPDCRY